MALKLSNTSIYQAGTTVDDNDNLFVDYFRVAQYMKTSPWVYPGLNRGFVGLGTPAVATYDTFPFAAGVTNAIPGGSFTRAADSQSAGTNSETHGYSVAGGLLPAPVNYGSYFVIDRFPFASTPVAATNVGSLNLFRSALGAHSSSTNGYASGGLFSPGPIRTNSIEKWPFASGTTNATIIGSTTSSMEQHYSHSSSTHGYTLGGIRSGTPNLNTSLDRFPFATDTNASSVGTIPTGKISGASTSSLTHGYNSGGATPAASINTIDRYPFAASSGATTSSVGTLSSGTRWQCAGASSLDFGYTMAGRATIPSPAGTNIIDRFPFASITSNAVDVGDMTSVRFRVVGLQW